MSQLDWLRIGIDFFQAVLSGAVLALLVYFLDRNKAKRERQYEYFRIATSWSNKKEKPSMRGFDLEKANLAGHSFKNVDLEGSNLKGAGLESVNLEGANLRATNFTGANLAGAKFIKTEAYRANFTNCSILPEVYPDELKYSDFSNSSMEEAKFCSAHILGAKFRGTSLVSVDFSKAIIHECDFTNADISNSNWLKTKSVTSCIWVGVKYNNETKLTEKLLYEIRKQNGQ
jgi:uncharacterized protein YjbI with pentapeptide repeats